jgi:TM2 domain-containing membrane protein YozV
VDFKAALALQRTGSYDEALLQFDHINLNSEFYPDARNEYSRTLFLKKDYTTLHNIFMETDPTKSYYPFVNKLDRITYFYTDKTLPSEDSFISSFPGYEKSYIKKFYEWQNDPPYKSPVLAGILSVIPGLGKVYTENYTDGLFAAVLTGVFGYIAYTDFKADHQTRAWIFTGVTAFFYAGNIYGSVASAQIYNAKIRFNFEAELHDFLNAFHYLSGDYNFCK